MPPRCHRRHTFSYMCELHLSYRLVSLGLPRKPIAKEKQYTEKSMVLWVLKFLSVFILDNGKKNLTMTKVVLNKKKYPT